MDIQTKEIDVIIEDLCNAKKMIEKPDAKKLVLKSIKKLQKIRESLDFHNKMFNYSSKPHIDFENDSDTDEDDKDLEEFVDAIVQFGKSKSNDTLKSKKIKI
jgi:hypothetical protein